MLVERERQLHQLADALDRALAGDGQLVFVSGGAGVGKTALVGELARRVPAATTIRRGVADNVTTAGALSPIIDAVPELADQVDTAASVDRTRLFRSLPDRLASTPTLLVLEDLHWGDEASLDALRYLGRRLSGLPLLLVATYRRDELAGRHPLAVVLGDLATEPGVARLNVEPISAAGVQELVAASGSTLDPMRLHERTGGNPFYVTEILAAPTQELPESVRDAVLARASRLSSPAFDVLAAAAVVGQAADSALLAAVAVAKVGAVDECIAHGLLVRDRDGWLFRHELARVAVEEALPPARLAVLHTHAYDELRERGCDDDRRLAHHAAGSGRAVAVVEHATRAGARAARLGAHGEAVEQYRLALRFVGADTRRAELLNAVSYECYLTDELNDALDARLAALEIAERTGPSSAVGQAQRWVSRLSWFLGRGADADHYADLAVATLEQCDDEHELAMAYSNRAQLYMLAADVDAAVSWGQRALDIAARTGDREVQIHALNNVGTALLQRNDDGAGWTMLQRSRDLALAEDAHEHVARAYTNLGSVAVANRRLGPAEKMLRAGIDYCTERDLDSWRLYMNGHLARVWADRGELEAAAATARDVLRYPSLANVSEVVAATTAAQVAIRTGGDAAVLLARSWELALASGEAQRLVPVAATYAEQDWLVDTVDATAPLERAWKVACERPAPWEIGELAYWRGLAGWAGPLPCPVPEPFALLLTGELTAAAAAWGELGCVFWQLRALADDPSVQAGRAALAIAERTGATEYRAAILRRRRRSGWPVPRGPRSAARGNSAALTARELEVLNQLGDGLTNAEIAVRLVLSEKTVGHHVSSILRKLGEPSRARAVAVAQRSGLLATPTAT